MTGDAVKAIAELAAPTITEISGVTMSDEELQIVDTTPEVKPLLVVGLQSIVDYLEANVDVLAKPELMVHVVDPWEVVLLGKLLPQ